MRTGWDGLVLIFTPRTKAEMEVVFQLIVESYNYMTGRSIKPADYKGR